MEWQSNGFDIPREQQNMGFIPFEVVVNAIRHAPRPVTLAEVAYHLTGFKGNQHLINPKFSGEKNKQKREEAGLYISHTEGKSAYWVLRDGK